jgi:hypothetical protein
MNVPLLATCLGLALLPQAADKDKAAEEQYGKLKGAWKVSSQDWYLRLSIPREYFVAFHALTFKEGECDVRFVKGRDKAETTVPLKVKICDRLDPPEIHWTDDDGEVLFRVIYRLDGEGKADIAVGIDPKSTPGGFDVKKDKIILLRCERATPPPEKQAR